MMRGGAVTVKGPVANRKRRHSLSIADAQSALALSALKALGTADNDDPVPTLDEVWAWMESWQRVPISAA
jgi:hypothetical protein